MKINFLKKIKVKINEITEITKSGKKGPVISKKGTANAKYKENSLYSLFCNLFSTKKILVCINNSYLK